MKIGFFKSDGNINVAQIWPILDILHQILHNFYIFLRIYKSIYSDENMVSYTTPPPRAMHKFIYFYRIKYYCRDYTTETATDRFNKNHLG